MLGLPFKATGSVEGLGSLANPFVRYCKNMENMTMVMTIRVHLRFELYFRQCAFEKHLKKISNYGFDSKELHVHFFFQDSQQRRLQNSLFDRLKFAPYYESFLLKNNHRVDTKVPTHSSFKLEQEF